jgi:uncharacterized protein YkwD
MYRTRLVLVALIVLAACAPVPKKPAEPTPPAPGVPKPAPPASVKVSGIEQKVIDATNAFRRDNHPDALKPSVRLIVIAQKHARNMASQDKFGDSDKNGHVLDGKSLSDRIQAGGYEFARVAENVGYQLNKPDPAASMMDGWKASSGHRHNMLLPDITEIGVGAAQGKSGRWYFVQVFGRPADPARPTQSQ